jgi:hypothetical protein
MWGGGTYSVGLLKRAYLNHWTSSVHSRCLPSFTLGRKQIQFPKYCVFLYFEFRTMDKAHNPSDSECYTPSSEPFRLYNTAVQEHPDTSQSEICLNLRTHPLICHACHYLPHAQTLPISHLHRVTTKMVPVGGGGDGAPVFHLAAIYQKENDDRNKVCFVHFSFLIIYNPIFKTPFKKNSVSTCMYVRSSNCGSWKPNVKPVLLQINVMFTA